MLGRLDYTRKPKYGEQITTKSPFYSHIRRVQQAIGGIAEMRSGDSTNPYNASDEGLVTTLQLSGTEIDPNTQAPLGSILVAAFYHIGMFKSIMMKDSLSYEALVRDLVTCTCPGMMKSPGKSPTFFVFGESGRYLIKQLKPKELRLMLSICASYGRHLLSNPSSLLIKIYSIFTITTNADIGASLSKLNTSDKHFMIIPNLFVTPRSIRERYDLKGSWVGRVTKVATPEDVLTKTLKDVNLENYVYLTTLRRRLLIHQLKVDSDWLQSHNLVDYSLLLGITDDIPCIAPRDKGRARGQVSKCKEGNSSLASSGSSTIPNTPIHLASSPKETDSTVKNNEKRNVNDGTDGDSDSDNTGDTPLQRYYSRLLAAKTPKTIISTKDISHMFPPVGYKIAHGSNRKTSISLASLSPDDFIAEAHRQKLTFEAAIKSNDILRSEEGGLYAFSPKCALGTTLEGSSLYYKVVYMGIIDFLTEFKKFKRIERRLKGLCNDKNGISAVPSVIYANRFMRFCRVIFQVPISEASELRCEECSEITIYEDTN